MRPRWSSVLLLVGAISVGCSASEAPDAGSTAEAGAPPPDAGPRDARAPDATAADAGVDGGDLADAGLEPEDAGLWDAATPDAADADAGAPDETRVRVVAANLTSGNFQSYDPGHGLRILEALAPDVILIQELNYRDDTQADLRALVDQVCGVTCAWVRGATGSIPNGVISRWPILESGTWPDDEVGNRGFTWARIDLPGPTDMWAVSVHLLTRNAGVRDDEAAQLVGYVQAQVPLPAYLVIGGDLNTDRRAEAALSTLAAVVRTDDVPVDADGNDNTNASRNKPYDWVLPDAELAAREVPVELGGQRFPEGLVFDTRVFEPLSAVPPAREGDSDAPQMQHMAVVRDFVVPR